MQAKHSIKVTRTNNLSIDSHLPNVATNLVRKIQQNSIEWIDHYGKLIGTEIWVNSWST